MSSHRNARDKKAHDDDNRQRRREITTELQRREDPPLHEEALAMLSQEVDDEEYPLTGAELLEAASEAELETDVDKLGLEEVVPDSHSLRFQSTQDLYLKLGRPTVASSIRRVVEAADAGDLEFGNGQLDTYRKSFVALQEIKEDDGDEGVEEIADWIVDRVEDGRGLPGSRAVRREAANNCREKGYTVSIDDWLGV